MRRVAALVLAPVLAWGGCSYVEPLPEELCESDEDCGPGEVCGTEFGNVCYPQSQLPPRSELAFEICEPQAAVGQDPCGFRTEIHGCDAEVRTGAVNELEFQRRDLSDQLVLRYVIPGEAGLDDNVLRPATLTLRQTSRLLRDPLDAAASYEPPVMEEDPDDIAVDWAYYHPEDPISPLADPGDGPLEQSQHLRAIVIEITPEPTEEEQLRGADPLAPQFAMLLRPWTDVDSTCNPDSALDTICDPLTCINNGGVGECAWPSAQAYGFPLETDPECHRSVTGRVVRIVEGGNTSPDLGGATVNLRFASDAAEPLLIPPQAFFPEDLLPCQEDDDCQSGQRCDPDADACYLDLGGRRAAKQQTSSTEEGLFGTFRVPVNTYCDGGPLQARELTLVAKGPAGLPELSYTFSQEFPAGAGDLIPDAPLPGLVCMPDWATPTPRQVTLTGNPVTVWGADDEAWVCCSTGCLPSGPEDDLTPVAETGCIGAAGSVGAEIAPSLRFETTLPTNQLVGWDDRGCLDPDLRPDGTAGRLTRTDSSCTESPCEIELGSGLVDVDQKYTLTVEPPDGSVLASKVLEINLSDDTEALPPIELQPRTLITGYVRIPDALCAEEEDCGAPRATVMAERLKLPEEATQPVPGPYFFTTPTFFDPVAGREGAFVLPVNPGGAYMLTALPANRASGAPAPFQVIDLRGRSGVEDVGEIVLDSDPSDDAVGVYVTMSMKGGFDRDASVLPLDVGSWRSIDHPAGAGRTLDLNSKSECYGDENAGCRIRALVAGDSGFFTNQVQEVRFIARSGATGCP